MNAHEELEDLVEPYVAGGLSATEREAFEDHLVDCAACTTAVADAQEFTAFMTESLQGLRPPDGLEDRLVAGMGWRTRPGMATWKMKPLPTWTKVAAAALFFVAVGAYAEMTPIVGATPAGLAVGLSGAALSPTASVEESGRFADRFAIVGDKKAVDFAEFQARSDRRFKALSDTEAVSSLEKQRKSPVSGGRRGGGGRGGGTGNDASNQELLLSLGKFIPEKDLARESPLQEAQDRKIIKNGNLEVEVDSFDAAFAAISELVTDRGGFVSSSSRQKLQNDKVLGTVVVRVPEAGFSAVVLELAGLGDLKNQSISTQEVTKEYVDLSARLQGKTVLAERLIKMLEDAEGELKDLLEVEKELGQVRGEIEVIQGELNYYDNLVSLSTITLNLRERDIEQPFEYVQTLESRIGIAVEDVESAWQRAQEIISAQGGRILDSGMTREGDDEATGTIVAAVDADAFPAVRQALRGLGTVSVDTVTRQQQPRGGSGGIPAPDAPVVREEARVSVQIATPLTVVTLEGNVSVIAEDPGAAFESARLVVETMGGEVTGGGMTDHVDGSRGTLQMRVDALQAPALIGQLEGLGEVEQSTVTRQQPPGDPGLRRERGQIVLSIVSPARLVDQSEGIGAKFRDTISGSFKGILWSLEMLVVGIAYAGPWLLGLVLVLAGYRRIRRKKAEVTAS